MGTPLERTAANTKIYAEACVEVGSRINIPVVNMWKEFTSAVGWKTGEPLVGSKEAPRNPHFDELFTDGLHLQGKGYRIMYDAVTSKIKQSWPEIDPQNIPFVFPPWREAPK